MLAIYILTLKRHTKKKFLKLEESISFGREYSNTYENKGNKKRCFTGNLKLINF